MLAWEASTSRFRISAIPWTARPLRSRRPLSGSSAPQTAAALRFDSMARLPHPAPTDWGAFFWPRDVHRNDFGADAVTGSIHGIVCRRCGLDCLLPAGYHRARQCRSRTLDFTHARRGAFGFWRAASVLAPIADTKVASRLG